MKIHWIKTNLSFVQKICLSGLFIALTCVLQKVVAINYLGFAPFIRVSLGGPALIIFASVLLGPIYGLFIGASSDVLGYFIFDIKAYPFAPQITAVYALLGFVAYFVFSLVFSIENKRVMKIVEITIMLIIWAVICVFMFTRNEIRTIGSEPYKLNMLTKILVCVISGIIFSGIVLLSFLLKPKDNRIYASPLHICFASFICDFFVIVLFGSLMKGFVFGFQTFIAILVCQAIIMFFNVLIDTLLISAFQRFAKKYYVEDQNVRRE